MRFVTPFVVLFLASLASAQQFYTVQGCMTEKGLGMVEYTISGNQQVDISELCVDRANGSIVASEAITGLQLVKQNGAAQDFENLTLGTTPEMRPLMKIAPVIHQTYHGGAIQDGSPEFFFINRGGPNAQRANTNQFQISGYLYDQLASPAALAGKTFNGLIMVGLYRTPTTPTTTIDLSMYSGLLFSGDIAFNGGQAKVALGGFPDEGLSMKNARGSLAITVGADGRLVASGELFAENSRIAGHAPGEWTSAAFSAPQLVGHAVGASGQVLKAYGFAQGEVVNVSGQRLPVTATLQFVAYDKAAF